MSNRISTLLLVTLVLLAGFIALELRGGVPSADALGAAASKQRSERKPDPLRLSLPPLETFSETTRRPLFIDTRRPPEQAAEAEPAAPAPVSGASPASFTISAIVINDEERSVLLSNSPAGGLTRVSEGDSIAGWRLQRVEKDRAVFTRDGETREATLRNFGPPPPPRPRRAAPPGQAAGNAARQGNSARDRREIRRLAPTLQQPPSEP